MIETQRLAKSFKAVLLFLVKDGNPHTRIDVRGIWPSCKQQEVSQPESLGPFDHAVQ
jgi:hypothetical protein